MKTYKLLTPGPLTATDNIKQGMLSDHCTWDEDYKQTTQRIRKELLQLAYTDETAYTTVLMQSSRAFGVESMIPSVIPDDDYLLLLSNGAYEERVAAMCRYHHISCVHITQGYDKIPDRMKAEEALKQCPEITHIVIIHSETTTGILNDAQSIDEPAKTYHKVFIVDTMSNFAGMDIPMHGWYTGFLVSSADRYVQDVPDFSFIITRRGLLIVSKDCARSLPLDLYDQWAGMEKNGKWRYTSPTHAVLAFAKAVEKLQKEGGIPTGSKRYAHNRDVLIEKFGKLGFLPYMEETVQGPIITTFLYPDTDLDFTQVCRFVKKRGYVIYPRKLTDKDTFCIGTIGEIYEENILRLAQIMEEYMESRGD